MAVEKRRGCGFRVVHGLYITSGPLSFTCDRLPIPTNLCKCCGNFVREFQGVQSFKPLELLGNHGVCEMCEKFPRDGIHECSHTNCTDPLTCMACFPRPAPEETKDFMMWVGRSYYTKDTFTAEAALLGVSKRIASNGVPIGMVPNQSWIFLAMRNIMDDDIVMVDGQKKRAHGIFMVFRIQKLEYLIWESEATDEYVEHLEDLGLSPVIIPDGDEDHTPKKKRPDTNVFAVEKMLEDAMPVQYPHHNINEFFEEMTE